jgi:hypothetical protein
MIEAYILIELSSGAKYKYVRNIVNDSLGKDEIVYKYHGSGYQEVGLKRKHSYSNTGLISGKTYQFGVNVDGGGNINYSITPQGNGEGYVLFQEIIKLMNQIMVNSGATWKMTTQKGNMRCTSDSQAAATSIALSAGAANDLFSALDGWTGGFEMAIAGDNYMDQTVAGKIKKDFTDLSTAYGALINFNDLLPFPEAGGAVTILKRKNLNDGLDDKTYSYLQIAAGEIVSISVIEKIIED